MTIMMMMMTIIIITIIMVVVQQKSANNFLAQLLVFNSSPGKVKLSLCFTYQNDMEAHAQKLYAFLTGQWSAARSGRYTPSIHYRKGWVGSTAGLHVLEFLAHCRESYHCSVQQPSPTFLIPSDWIRTRP